MFGKKTPESLARDELEELERELFVLHKNMQHDRHRLAYIKARRRQLSAAHPAAAQEPAASASVRWIGRREMPAEALPPLIGAA